MCDDDVAALVVDNGNYFDNNVSGVQWIITVENKSEMLQFFN